MTLDLFSEIPRSPDKATWIDRARDVARRIAEERGTVTADDVWDAYPPPKDIDARAMGCVFEGLVWAGYTKSRRKECHFRPISRFRIERSA